MRLNSLWRGVRGGVSLASLVVLCVACGDDERRDRDGEGGAGGQACEEAELDECGVCGGEGPRTWYADYDHDGLGDPAVSEVSCERPLDFVGNADDPDPTCIGLRVFYRDADGDGLGDPADATEACAEPDGYVRNRDDGEPTCATNDSDECGVCAGQGPKTWHPDVDDDGRGDPDISIESCESIDGWVQNDDDREPNCATDDTDDCGVCGGDNESRDCAGVCDGEAELDACRRCTGGMTGREPAVLDSDDDGTPDLCDCAAPGVARTIFQWTEMDLYGAELGGPYTFQIILFENGDFAYAYHDVEPFGDATVTVGHQGPEGEGAVELGYESRYPTAYPLVYFRRTDRDTVVVEYTVDLPWADIASTGTGVSLADDGLFEVELPFRFPYGTDRYDSVFVSDNGFLGLSEPFDDETWINRHLPTSYYGALLAAFWDDLDPATGGAVRYQHLDGSCEPDCHGDFGGVAERDVCGVCSGGNTGVTPGANRDCNGDCFGDAYLDDCRTCVGGRTGEEPSEPGSCATGPDLLLDGQYLRGTIQEDVVDVPTDSCLVNEACVTGTGRRRVVRFGTRIANVGNEDVVAGAPVAENPLWAWDPCHGHYHFEDYANHDLVDVATGQPLPIGTKNGFCMLDLETWDAELATNGCSTYDCEYQGISVGCADTYSSELQCQWVDITGVPDGDYDLRVTVNPERAITELSYENNSAMVRLRISDTDVRLVDQ